MTYTMPYAESCDPLHAIVEATCPEGTVPLRLAALIVLRDLRP